MSSQQNGQTDPSPGPPATPSPGNPGITQTSEAGMRSAAKRLNDSAELLDTYAEQAFYEELKGPGIDPVSAQATKILRGHLDDRRMAAENLANTFRQHAEQIESQLSTSQEIDADIYWTFRGELQ